MKIFLIQKIYSFKSVLRPSLDHYAFLHGCYYYISLHHSKGSIVFKSCTACNASWKKWVFHWIMCTKGICSWVLIDTLNRYPPLTLDWHRLTLDPYSINILVDSQWTVKEFSIDAHESVDTQATIDWLLIKCWSSSDRVSIRMSIGTDQDANRGYWLWLLIDSCSGCL